MKTSVKVAGFAAGLVAIFVAALVIGGAIGPFDDDNADGGADHGRTAKASTKDPGGLMVSQAGYTLRPAQTPAQPGTESELRFWISDSTGAPVTGYTETHDKDLHLILVRRDLAHYQHVHPTLADDGMWTVPVNVPAAGQYRMFADFQPDGRDDGLTLGADFAVAGDYAPVPVPEPAATATVDGYAVTISGRLTPGKTSKLTLEVTRDGQPVTDLQPYLEAYGHLVALRDGDLAYLHVHPDGAPGDGKTKPGPQIVFYAEVPSTGQYRLYLDFKHGDVVRTAEFTARAGDLETDRTDNPDENNNEHGGHG